MNISASSPVDTHPVVRSGAGRIHEVTYDPKSTLGALRSVYFAANGFPPDGGYEAKWVDFELGPIPMPFPNTAGRRAAVKVHDLHHVLTGYQTDIHGEVEISAWELASGCRRMPAAWVLNLGGMAFGMLIAPRRTFRAWVRGSSTRNLYDHAMDEALLARKLGEVRAELGLDTPPAPVCFATLARFFLHWQLGAWGALAMTPLAVLSAVGVAVMGFFVGQSRR